MLARMKERKKDKKDTKNTNMKKKKLEMKNEIS